MFATVTQFVANLFAPRAVAGPALPRSEYEHLLTDPLVSPLLAEAAAGVEGRQPGGSDRR